ncbi:hypothetical protein [Rhizobium leguminosarum]|uniref:hypothetical protein n=1 Tax=Rhizobium leguminosarum TaxID=384 RepID=UPI001C989E97|nr:hypothetical protein [Rhizobium leguminosarum]MBY5579594.1 hypothetical protein [Rhizobium leguminosarum]
MTQKSKGPAEAATSPSLVQSTLEGFEMNEIINSTDAGGTPSANAATPLRLQLGHISDLASNIGSMIDAIDMAISDIDDSRQRNAMATLCDVVMDKMDDLKKQINAVREELR